MIQCKNVKVQIQNVFKFMQVNLKNQQNVILYMINYVKDALLEY